MLRLPTEHPTVHDLVWAAGLYEGEGNVDSGTTQKVTIVQKDRWVIERLLALFGGSVYVDKRGISYWYLTGPTARGFLFTIFTRLSPRRRGQVRSALSSWRPPMSASEKTRRAWATRRLRAA